jgi:hypothetical protein
MQLPPEAPALVLLGAAAALAPARQARMLAFAVVMLGFSLASVRVAAGLHPVTPIQAVALASLPGLTRGIDGGMALAGLIAAIAALPLALRWTAQPLHWLLALLLLTGTVLAADATVEAIRAAGWPVLAAATVAALLLGVVLARLGNAAKVGSSAPARPHRLWLAGTLLLLVILPFAPHALAIIAGAMLVSVTAHVAARRGGMTKRFPLLPVAVIPLLAFAGYFLAVIAGPVGLATARFPDVPLSPAAQLGLAPPLLIAALLFCGPPLLRRWLPGSALALVGATLLVRLAVPLLGDALPGWETLFVPLGVLLLWVACLARDNDSAAGMGAWLSGLIVAPLAAEGAWLLAAAALCLAAGQWSRHWGMAAHLSLRAAAGALAAAGGAAAVAAMLQHQVVYGVFSALAALTLITGTGAVPAMIYSAGSPDSTAFPGDGHGVHTSSAAV